MQMPVELKAEMECILGDKRKKLSWKARILLHKLEKEKDEKARVEMLCAVLGYYEERLRYLGGTSNFRSGWRRGVVFRSDNDSFGDYDVDRGVASFRYACGVSVNPGRRKRYGKKRPRRKCIFRKNVWYDR